MPFSRIIIFLVGVALAWPLPSHADDSEQQLVVNLHLAEVTTRIFSASGRLAYSPPAIERRIERSRTDARRLAHEQGLVLRHEWAIPVLDVYCVVFALPAEKDRGSLLEALRASPLVESIQPMNRFTVATDSAGSIVANATAGSATGRDVSIAIVDTGADLGHPALATAQIDSIDLVEPAAAAFPAEHHATSILGVLAARDESTGLVGVVPEASLRLLRACWETMEGRPAECNTFTLAKALALLAEQPPDIVNLSISGPRDRLLERLAGRLVELDVILVAAGGSRDGFPGSVPGSLLAVEHFDAADKVMTLLPGGRIGMQAGSSMAAARLSAEAAQRLQFDPGATAASLSEDFAPSEVLSRQPR